MLSFLTFIVFETQWIRIVNSAPTSRGALEPHSSLPKDPQACGTPSKKVHFSFCFDPLEWIQWSWLGISRP